MSTPTLYQVTPCLPAPALSRASGREIWLKLENLQPSGSFKLRGVGSLCAQLVQSGCSELVASSGGNAGYSAAWAARELGVPIRVFLPAATSPGIQAALTRLGASLQLAGTVWDEAHEAARAYTESGEGRALVHPFDDPRIWSGHATMIRECAEQAPRPDCVVLSVGGGGLLTGVIEGLHAVGWQDVPVLAVETRGAASFAAALAAGRPVTLDRIDTVARTLGARRICAEAWNWTRRHEIHSLVIDDADALAACRAFAEELRMLVEPACGAALSAVYHHLEVIPETAQRILVIVCGGIDVWPKLGEES